MITDPRKQAPAVARNRDPILTVLKPYLRGSVLEIASGTGEHIVHFAQNVPDATFQPSDPDASSRASIDAWAESLVLDNIRLAVALDASAPNWPVERADTVVCINMIHISPWEATIGLVNGAARLLPAGGTLFLYGPYKRGGQHTAPSNEAFDRDFLRARNPAWGVRDLEAVTKLAGSLGFDAPGIVEMPANNLSLVFRRL